MTADELLTTAIADYQKQVQLDLHLQLKAVAQLKFRFLQTLLAVRQQLIVERGSK